MGTKRQHSEQWTVGSCQAKHTYSTTVLRSRAEYSMRFVTEKR